MAYWLVKSEPGDWSWDDQTSVESEPWDGVRNFQAQKNMRAMKIGDQVLFYHSGKAREIVGLCKVVREEYPDPDDASGKFCLIDLKAERPLGPLSLVDIKSEAKLAHLALVKQPRLSVMPIDEDAWNVIIRLCDS
jgi:predicted RNA-binding protein with PUA-like domain